jgi:hypothetical protein
LDGTSTTRATQFHGTGTSTAVSAKPLPARSGAALPGEKTATLKTDDREDHMSTKYFMQIMMVVATVVTFGSAPVLAQEKGHGMMEQGRGMGGMGQQRGMRGTGMMDKKMQELRHHQKMMEGIKDRDQMMTEMRKHMQMMTDMMEEMTRQQEGATGGSEGMPEHPMPEHPMPEHPMPEQPMPQQP